MIGASSMVRKGEYLERAVVIPHGDGTLDGLYHRGRRGPGVVFACPHPDHGSFELPLIAELAWAVTRAGHPTLRFNYPGVGGSPGTFSEDAARDALDSAMEHLALSDERESIAAIAVGWGGTLVARAAEASRLASLVLVQPPASVWPMLSSYDGAVRAVFAAGDPAPARSAAAQAATACRNATVDVVPLADSSFRIGLVAVGQLVVETLENTR